MSSPDASKSHPSGVFLFGFPIFPAIFLREPRQSLPRSASSLPRSKFTGGFPMENAMGNNEPIGSDCAPLSSSSMGPNSPKHHPLPVSHPLPKKFTHQKKKNRESMFCQGFPHKSQVVEGHLPKPTLVRSP